jgi:hypothetical protein
MFSSAASEVWYGTGYSTRISVKPFCGAKGRFDRRGGRPDADVECLEFDPVEVDLHLRRGIARAILRADRAGRRFEGLVHLGRVGRRVGSVRRSDQFVDRLLDAAALLRRLHDA